MTDRTFDELMQRHEMGQAYKVITENMGPSLQLLAFVNYDKIDNGNFGLESLNIMSQHEEVLAQIDADPSYDLAMESFTGRLKSVAAKLKNITTLNKHARDLEKFATGTLVSRKSNVYVMKPDQFKTMMDAGVKNKEIMDRLHKMCPSSTSNKDWEAFGAKHISLKGATDLDRIESEIDALGESSKKAYKMFSDVDFAESGWTASNFQASVKIYLKLVKYITAMAEIIDELYSKLYAEADSKDSYEKTSFTVNKVEKTDKDTGVKTEHEERVPTYSKNASNKDAVRAMNKMAGIMRDTFALYEYTDDYQYRILKNVAQHFDTK